VPFVPPTRLTFRTTVLRALRDPNGAVFPAATVNDFINESIMDMSAYRPHEVNRTQAWTVTDTGFPVEFVDDLSDIWQMVARVSDLRQPTIFIPHADYADGRAGWDFFGNSDAPLLRLARVWTMRLRAWAERDDSLSVSIYAYGMRSLPADDNSRLDFHNLIDQFCSLQHCKMLGFQMLNADRALYQQWLAATNNTDVSPTQLQGMLGQSEMAFDKARHRNTIIRRRPTNAETVAL
jgi:hypothetical protein